jgi:hypothetical protein
MLSIYDLLLYFWIGLTLMVTLVLLLISPTMPTKSWYFLVLVSFAPWAQVLLSKQATPFPLWVYLLPILWIILTLWLAFPKTNPEDAPNQFGEPKTTLEYIRGPAGTSEALRVYFTLVFLVSVAGLLLFKIIAASSYW